MQTMYATEGSTPSPLLGGADLLPPGSKAGPWIVGSPLGHGGMGSVYAVVHEDIGKRAALKVVHRRLCDGSTIKRILVEARVVNRVAHPNIVDIFETGILDDGRPYIVMERLDGISLGRFAFETKILPDRVIDILLQICGALVAAHAAGIIHRDLKVDNVFLLDDPDDPRRSRVKVLDWGIAKEIENNVRNTVEGLLVGTPQYLSPEQARGAELTPATDVYSLGVMAYELFLEQLPFEADTSAELMTMHLRSAPPPPSELWPDIPSGLEQLLLAMLSKLPETRPSMPTVARTLELVRDELDRRRGLPLPEARRPARWSTAQPLSIETPARWRRGARTWQVVVGAVALVASMSMFVVSRDHDSSAATIATVPAAAVPPIVLPAAPPEPPPLVVVAAPPIVKARPKLEARPRPHRSSVPTASRASGIDPDGSIEAY